MIVRVMCCLCVQKTEIVCFTNDSQVMANLETKIQVISKQTCIALIDANQSNKAAWRGNVLERRLKVSSFAS